MKLKLSWYIAPVIASGGPYAQHDKGPCQKSQPKNTSCVLILSNMHDSKSTLLRRSEARTMLVIGKQLRELIERAADFDRGLDRDLGRQWALKCIDTPLDKEG